MDAAVPYETDVQCQPDPPGRALVLVRSQGQAVERTEPAKPTTADSEAISELWRIHGPTLLRFALKLSLGDGHRAQDIVQETLLRAWRHPEVVGGHAETIRPWLFTVTRHVAIDMWRARTRKEEIIDDQPTDRPNPVESIEQAMTAMDVRAALAQLTPEHRQVIVEMYYRGRSVAEIAQILKIPEGTVKSRTYYGLRRLKRLLSAAPGDPMLRTHDQFPRALSA